MKQDLLSVVIAVLSDWRVVAAALFFLFAAALLRYVGLVLSRERRRPVLRKAEAKALPPPAGRAARQAPKAAEEEAEEEGEELVL